MTSGRWRLVCRQSEASMATVPCHLASGRSQLWRPIRSDREGAASKHPTRGVARSHTAVHGHLQCCLRTILRALGLWPFVDIEHELHNIRGGNFFVGGLDGRKRVSLRCKSLITPAVRSTFARSNFTSYRKRL
jgi:hypothetical protein